MKQDVMETAVALVAGITAAVLYALGYLHGRGHRFIDRIFGRDQ